MVNLRVQDISKKYNRSLVVKNVSFSLLAGRIYLLLGPNGAGKSTLIKCILGLIPDYNGSVEICGYSNTDIEAKRRVSYVPEQANPYSYLTVKDHLEFTMLSHGMKLDSLKINKLLDDFKLSEKKNELGKNLSKGMKQKLNICCALITNPEIIIFDEPLVGLDPESIYALKRTIGYLKQRGCTVLISTHLISAINDWDTTFVMNNGELVTQINCNDVENNEDLEALFLSLTEDRG